MNTAERFGSWGVRRLGPVGLVLLLLMGVEARPAGAESPIERIRERGKLIIGTDATYPPFESIEDGKIQGFDVAIGDEVARELGVEAAWVNMGWDGIFPSLQARKFDLVMSGVTITAERKESLGFSRPYFLSGQTIVRRRGDPRVQDREDLTGRRVAVQVSTTGQKAAEDLGLRGEEIQKFDTLQDALLAVRNRSADAAIGDEPALVRILRMGYPELELTGGVFVEENLGVVARPDEAELIAAVNAALAKILADGRYARIYRQWMGEELPAGTIARLDAVGGQGTSVVETAGRGAPGIRWDLLRRSLPLLWQGAQLTLVLTVLALLIGVPAGLLVALARLSAFRPLSWLATAYVEVVRGTPLLMQIYVIYFVLPSAGVSLEAFPAGVCALSLNAAAYIGEIFRAGIESIEAGQMEAARSLGMDYGAAMRWVILPQTVRRVLPPLTNEAVALLKDSSLVSVVALAELMRVGKEIAANSGSPATVYLAIALFYLAMTLPLTHLVRVLERRWQPISRPRAPRAARLAPAGK